VWLNLRRPFSKQFQLRKENEWPLGGTRWTKLFLDADVRFAQNRSANCAMFQRATSLVAGSTLSWIAELGIEA
jgi:hypothetical protein